MSEENKQSNDTAIKPEFLYHASPNRNIELLEPKQLSYRDKSEGQVIFATGNEVYVTMFLVRVHDDWGSYGFFGKLPYFICSNKEKFLSMDKGGAIYKLPSDTFVFDSKKSGGLRQECTSSVSVKPISKKVYESGLKAMTDSGVHVFFVEPEEFSKLKSSFDELKTFLSSKILELKK